MADPSPPAAPSRRDRARLIEAGVWLLLARIALRTLSFARIAALAGGDVGAPQASAATAERIGKAVEMAAGRSPWPALCFERALAAHAMLRRRGRASRLFYGAHNGDSRGPMAHVWVRSGDRAVVGGDEAAGFAILAAFPPIDR